jgi:serine/threonine protein kinase
MLAVSEDSLLSFQNKKLSFETLLKENGLKLMGFAVSREIETTEVNNQIEINEGKTQQEVREVRTRTRFMRVVGEVTMAPEVAKLKPYGIKADIYSLGVLTYFIVCGKYPFNPGY